MIENRRVLRSSALLLTAALGALARPAFAQESASPADEQLTTSQDIVVLAQIGYRNREDESAVPVLSYDTDYFQRFEPLTAGDALRRVPSVTFLSDVIESDGARLRGLPPAYTQITINGERVPGSNADRSFFLDRIPAELISRVEIVRSSTARRTGDAVAGTLNIVLRDGLELDGGYLRLGGLHFDDNHIAPSIGGVFGTAVGEGRLLLGMNIQGRHNPKIKFSQRFGDSPENDPDYVASEFDNREDQTDTRNGTDYAFNATYNLDGEHTDIELAAFFVRTDRTEDERSFEYSTLTGAAGPIRRGGNLLTDNANVAEIDQTNYTLEGRIEQEWGAGETTLKLSYSRFIEDRYETEYDIDFDRSRPRFTGDLTTSDKRDSELAVQLQHEIDLTDDIDLVFGGYFQDKDRGTNIREDRNRFDVPSYANWDQFVSNPEVAATPFDPAVAAPGGFNQIEEQRQDLFALIEGDTGPLRWEIGVRYETTNLRIEDFTVAGADALQTNDYDYWLPSASLRWDVSPVDRITLSGARTNRRPNFDFISPALLEAELGDNDLLGNPQLAPETAWGIDAGYERRIGRTGVIGVNFFYRWVDNLIEITNTGAEGSEGPGTFVLQPANVGNGEVWGIEFDLSASLGFVGLSNTGIFANFSWLDSRITDFAGERRFNGQSDYVFNVGFIQDLPAISSAFGVTYREQGAAFDRLVGEEVTTRYGGELEAFIEHRIGNRATIRFVASNLLDSSKDDIFNKFNTIEDQLDRSFDEYELETESAGPVFQLMVRYAF